jgi:hypothetical protein
LPENHTDFILASIGEELGLAGICVVLGLFGLLVWRGLVTARQAPDRFGTYLAVALSALFGFQALINMAVVLNLIPAKGITLPFLSYGGSSLMVSMGAVGILAGDLAAAAAVADLGSAQRAGPGAAGGAGPEAAAAGRADAATVVAIHEEGRGGAAAAQRPAGVSGGLSGGGECGVVGGCRVSWRWGSR